MTKALQWKFFIAGVLCTLLGGALFCAALAATEWVSYARGSTGIFSLGSGLALLGLTLGLTAMAVAVCLSILRPQVSRQRLPRWYIAALLATAVFALAGQAITFLDRGPRTPSTNPTIEPVRLPIKIPPGTAL